MASCTGTGFSGSQGYSFSGSNAIPANVVVVLAGYVQAALTQTATITDSNGTTVAKIQGTGGTGGVPVVMTAASGSQNSFKANGGTYTLTVTNSGSQDSRVLVANDTVSSGTTAFTASWTFIAEDLPASGICDFNDSTLFVAWNLFSG